MSMFTYSNLEYKEKFLVSLVLSLRFRLLSHTLCVFIAVKFPSQFVVFFPLKFFLPRQSKVH